MVETKVIKRMSIPILLGTLMLALSIAPVMATVTLKAEPDSCKVCSPAKIKISVASDQSAIFVAKGDLTIKNPSGTTSKYDHSISVGSGQTYTSHRYPDTTASQHWTPDGNCKKAGTYTVTLKYTQDGKVKTATTTFTRAKECGGFMFEINKFELLAPYIGLASTISVVAAVTVVFARRRKMK